MSPGASEVVAIAVDEAGNETTSAPVSFVLDRAPPVIELFAPRDYVPVNGFQTFSCRATDDVRVTRLELTVDGQPVGQAAAGSAEISWDSRRVADGIHDFVLVATDASGKKTSRAERWGVDNTAPAARFLTPANGQRVTGITEVTVAASDQNGVQMVRFYVDEVPAGTIHRAPFTHFIDFSKYATGTRIVRAVAYDHPGNTTSIVTSVTVERPATSDFFRIVAPTDGQILADNFVMLTGEAADPARVWLVQFFVDGAYVTRLYWPNGTRTYRAYWYAPWITSYPVKHTVEMRVTDTSGRMTRYFRDFYLRR